MPGRTKGAGRKKIELSPNKIFRINFLYYTNDRNLTDIAKIVGHSPPVCERHILGTRREFNEWYDRMVAEGKL